MFLCFYLVPKVVSMDKLQGDTVTLDVGGTRFVTSVSILRSRPGSMLDVMFSGNIVVRITLIFSF